MDDQLAREVGERVRFQRLAAKKTQAVIAGLAGISTDYLYQIERGKKAPTLQVLLALARALGISASALIDDPSPRSSVAGAQGESIDALHRALTVPGTAGTAPVPAPVLRSQVDAAWAMWQSSPKRYSTVAPLLGPLAVGVDLALRASASASAEGNGLQRVAADFYGLVRTVAKRMGRLDLSFVAADRARRAAEASGDRLRVAAAQWNLAHVALAEHDYDIAEDIAMTASQPLTYGTDDAAAVRGSLILVAAVAAARRRDPWVARDRIRAASEIARRTGERNTLWTAFGPTNVAMHAVSVELEAGETSEANHLADHVDYENSPSIERRVAFLLDQARSHQRRRDYSTAFALLRGVEREAPEDVIHRPAARDILQAVVQRAHRTTANEAANLADRLAVPLG